MGSIQSAYGLGQPLIGVPLSPIISDRNPTVNDKAQIGQIWVNPSSFAAYILVAVSNNQYIWGLEATPVIGDMTITGHLTVNMGITGVAGGLDMTGDSIFRDNLTINADVNVPFGDLTVSAGNLYAANIETNTSATQGVGLWENYVFATGTDPDVDVLVVPKGTGEFVIDGLWGGVLLSQWRTGQASAQTTDATPTLLNGVALDEGEMIVVKAVVNGFKSTYDHALSGDILISAFRPMAGNITQIGAKVITSYIDDTATPGIKVDALVDVGTQSLILQVTGAVGETWNWVTTMSYMYTTHP